MNRRAKFLFLGVLLAGIFLRFFRLGELCFWCDEFLAISFGWQPLKSMIDYITFNDAHPPLFYALVHLMLKYKISEFYLRLLPAFFGVLSIPAAFLTGKKLKDNLTGLILATIISLNPAFILWSRILKSYTMFTFFLLISVYFFAGEILIEEKRKIRYITFLFLSDIILLYLHNFAFILILIEFSVLVILKKLNKKWLFYYGFLFICYLPWLLRIPYQLRFTLGVVRPFPLLFRYFYLYFYFFFGETLYPFNFFIILPFLLVLFPMLIKSFKELCSLRFPKKCIILCGIFIPLILVPFPSTVPQNLLPYSTFFFLFLTLAGNFKTGKFLFICFFVITSFSTYFYFTKNVKNFHDVSKLIPYREINIIFSERLNEQDIIFSNEKKQFFTDRYFSAFEYYYKGKAKVIEAREELIKLDKISEIASKSRKIGLFLNYNENPEWCNKLKDFFFENYKCVYQKKFLYNERLLSRLKKKKREFYWFIEIYIFEKNKKK